MKLLQAIAIVWGVAVAVTVVAFGVVLGLASQPGNENLAYLDLGIVWFVAPVLMAAAVIVVAAAIIVRLVGVRRQLPPSS